VLPPLGPLSLGTGPLGNLFTPVPEDDAAGVVRAALAAGIRYVDTAPHYGAGLAERRLGAALAGVPRDSYVLSTKVGRLLVPRGPGEPPDDEGFVDEPPYRRVWDFSADGVRRSVEASLSRLGVDRVDVLYLHDAAEHEDEVYRTGFPAVAALRDEGLVTAIGAGLNQADVLTRFVTRLDLDVVLAANSYTLLDQSALASLLPACAARGVTVVSGAPFNSGILMGVGTFTAPEPARRRAAALRAACADHDVPLTAAALQFPSAHPAIGSVLVGCRSTAELTANLAAATTPIPVSFWTDLRTRGLLDPTAPLPTGPGG
jgi:D-threo-aldose 1-dehydrogenase